MILVVRGSQCYQQTWNLWYDSWDACNKKNAWNAWIRWRFSGEFHGANLSPGVKLNVSIVLQWLSQFPSTQSSYLKAQETLHLKTQGP
ncbi:unnamed protein product [Musa acuminata subsp. malaccensis]|uniref:(wild Malaysian banana) hypothetical protein n=1 Tax=Musa acuminata subsp. malaccensis TaxID=214687 RepID=A0A804ILK3_MUSAM|nr:unnamed protein product [Musa acuminata subsp. malaccensis]